MDENLIQGMKGADQKIADSVSGAYDRIVKEEADKQQAEVESAAAQEFDKVRRLGFVTKKDLEEMIAAWKEKSETETLRKDFTELREFVLRAKVRGLNTGKVEEDIMNPAQSELKAWERPFFKDMKR